MSGKPRFFISDVFASEKYSGNQLATFVDCEAFTDELMQQIAREINFSETTFITSSKERNGGYDVRIFTPAAEVEFAGHPTIGTAAIIRDEIIQSEVDGVCLNLPIGQIPVNFSKDDGMVWMTQAKPETGKAYDAETLAAILNIAVDEIHSDWPITEVSTGFPHLIVPLTSLAVLKKVKINKTTYFELVNESWAKLILVFAPEAYTPSQDLVVRVFADYYGIPEDAATGSGNGALAAYLALNEYFGKREINIKTGQGYEIGRPSELSLAASMQGEGLVVKVGGKVIRIAEGIWEI